MREMRKMRKIEWSSSVNVLMENILINMIAADFGIEVYVVISRAFRKSRNLL